MISRQELLDLAREFGLQPHVVEKDYALERGSRLIEPYSLRQTDAGNLLLYAVRADSVQSRSYRVDRILDARVSARTFTPRYVVELSR